MSAPRLTVVVVVPGRGPSPALASLTPDRQEGVAPEDYEVVAVDAAGVEPAVAAARAPVVGILADGSREAPPGTVAAALASLGRGVAVVEPGIVLLPRAGDRYVDLLKQVLLGEPGLEAEAAYFLARDALNEAGVEFDETLAFDVRARRAGYFERLRAARANGFHLGWETRNAGFPYTMVGRARLENVAECVHAALNDDVPGDLVECGAWRGGVTILMRGILAARGITDRAVWVADSFEGVPPPESPGDKVDISKASNPELAVTEQRVRASFERFGLLDDQVRFLPGWFKDTLPGAPIERIAVLRLDGDIYSSTMTALSALHDKVSPGGFVIVDDYGLLEECRQAVDEFREERGIDDPIVEIDWTGVYWRRSG